MVAVALCALLLALAVWTFRQAEALRLARLQAEQARAVAEEARVVAEVRAALLARSAQAAAKLGTADQTKVGSLWAGLSVNHPIFRAGQTKDLRIEFTLVNDGDKVIDPRIPESQIVINGKELSDSGSILSSVEEGTRFKALPRGESLRFDRVLGDRFKQPGVYRVSWKGAGFQSSEIVLRILPEEAC
jgi:hypothetical protein